jgi:hypothetical protein
MSFGVLKYKSNIMTTINIAFGKTLLLCFAILFTTSVFGQAKKNEIKNMIDSGQFIFHAQTAHPLSGPSRHLTSEYNLKVSNNSVVSYLPFFGRAYSLPYNSSEGGFNFTSTKFDYQSTPGKKGGWELSIKPRDVADFREFSLTISGNGYGTLVAQSTNRQPISFTGYISALK